MLDVLDYNLKDLKSIDSKDKSKNIEDLLIEKELLKSSSNFLKVAHTAKKLSASITCIESNKLEQESREGYNKARYDKETQTFNNVTYIHEEDNSVSINGTASNYSSFYLSDNFEEIEVGTYTVAVMYNKATTGDVHFDIRSDVNEVLKMIHLTGTSGSWNVATFSIEESKLVRPMLYITNNKTVENINVKFMLLKGEYTSNTLLKYEKYGQMPSYVYKSEYEGVTGDIRLKVSNKNNDEEQVFTIFLGNKILYKGDKIVRKEGKWYFEKHWKEFDKDIVENDINRDSQGFYFGANKLDNIKQGSKIYSICQKEKNIVDSEWNTFSGNFIGQLYPNNHRGVYINFIAESKAEIIEWYNNLHNKFIYELENEEFEPIEEEFLINQLDSILLKIKEYDDITNFEFDNDVVFEIEVERELLPSKIIKNNIYSSNPTKIGVWIKEDGSELNIYRKYINVGTLPNASSKNVDLGVNINSIIITRFDIFPYNPTANWCQTIPSGNKDNPITIEFSGSNAMIFTTSNRSVYTQTYAIFEYVDLGD